MLHRGDESVDNLQRQQPAGTAQEVAPSRRRHVLVSAGGTPEETSYVRVVARGDASPAEVQLRLHEVDEAGKVKWMEIMFVWKNPKNGVVLFIFIYLFIYLFFFF